MTILSSPNDDSGGYPRRRRPLRAEITAERDRIKLEKLRKKVRRQWKNLGLKFSPLQLEQEAQRRWAEAHEPEHPHLARYLIQTIPSSVAVPRGDVVPLVELAAMRSLEQTRGIEAALTGGIAFGQRWERRRSGNRAKDGRLAIALWEDLAFLTGQPNVLAAYHELARSNPLLHWANGHPWTHTVETYRGGIKGLHAICRHTDPGVMLVANMSAFQTLAELTRDPDVGRFGSTDGMWIPASREQRQSGSVLDDELLNHGLTIALGSHGKTFCRGWSLTVITDLKTTLPMVWLLRPANEREYTGVTELLDTLFRLWPECPLTYLAGDSEYDQDEKLSLTLEAAYGVHPAFYQRGEWGKSHRWHKTGGTPECSRHGTMKLYQSDDFVNGPGGRELRRSQGFSDGQPIDLSGARHRWHCPDCAPDPQRGDWVYTRFTDNPRLYAWLPWEGSHHRVGLRLALHARRNASESLNACLQSWGLGLPGKAGPFWCNEDADMAWFASGVITSQTLRRLAHASGRYQQHLAEAKAFGLLTPETDADYRAWKEDWIDVDEDAAA